ncbi:cysteine synthase [Francisella halioticida]|uniref:cysteine synthase n=1 Tax=Francisella halioticida TaxID=549298 RepID=A0ABM6M0M6_9GAMM|nr:cysteine synthase family protein [Francisella halioticida]ASG68238.1 cysteine synthase [Francisella halioticida]
MISKYKTTEKRIITDFSELIGGTPLFELARTGSGSRLLVKLEQFNPTGSCKVRMAREMILAAEYDGRLKPGGHIVEPTSGNTGTGLAFIAIERGYKYTAIVDNHASRDKLLAMQALGANLIFVESGSDKPSTVRRRQVAEEIVKSTGAFWPDQHYNPNNSKGYANIANELLSDIDTNIDYLIGAVGTGGTLCGTVRELRNLGSKVTSIGVEPTGSIIFGGKPGKYLQTGAGAPEGFTIGSNVDYSLIDEGLTVTDIDAFNTARVVAYRKGMLLGGTSGAAIYVALKRLMLVEPNSTIVVLACDAGEKYLDTIYNDNWLEERSLLNKSIQLSIQQLFDAYQDSIFLASKTIAV